MTQHKVDGAPVSAGGNGRTTEERLAELERKMELILHRLDLHMERCPAATGGQA